MLQSGAAAELKGVREGGKNLDKGAAVNQNLCSKDFCRLQLGREQSREKERIQEEEGYHKCPGSSLLHALFPLLSSS